MYNMGFAIFTLFSILLSVTWLHGRDAALFMIVMRLMQGVGGAFIMANTAAILTDAFPPTQRGLALGTNMVAAIAGSFIGLVARRHPGAHQLAIGVLGLGPGRDHRHRLGRHQLEGQGVRNPARIDWFGNAAFAIGLIALLVGIVYGIEPYAGHTMGWTNPWVLASLIGGLARLPVRLDRDEGTCPRCSASRCSRSALSRRAAWPASWPPSGGAGSCSSSSSGYKGSGCRATGTASPKHRCGPGFSCFL